MPRAFKTLSERMVRAQSAVSAPPVSRRAAFGRGAAIWLGVIAQIGILILAWYGYVHTVLPVYRKELLEEQIADKELELRDLRVDVAKATRERSTLNEQTAALEKRRAETQQELSVALSRAANAESRAREANNQLAREAQRARHEALRRQAMEARQKSFSNYAKIAEANCSLRTLITADHFRDCMMEPIAGEAKGVDLDPADLALLFKWIEFEAVKSSQLVSQSTQLLTQLSLNDPRVSSCISEESPIRQQIVALSSRSELRHAVWNAAQRAYDRADPARELRRPNPPTDVTIDVTVTGSGS